jgi:hypothetical protein
MYGGVIYIYEYLSLLDFGAPMTLLHRSPLCPCCPIWTGWLPRGWSGGSGQTGCTLARDCLHGYMLHSSSSCSLVISSSSCSLVIGKLELEVGDWHFSLGIMMGMALLAAHPESLQNSEIAGRAARSAWAVCLGCQQLGQRNWPKQSRSTGKGLCCQWPGSESLVLVKDRV